MSSLLNLVPLDRSRATAGHHLRRANVIWALWFAAILASTAVTALFVLYVMPLPLPVSAWFLVATVVAIVIRPRYGLYFILFFSLLGDSSLVPWYPFVKNFSSPESILYLGNAFIVNPLECYLVLIVLVWLGKAAMSRKFELYKGELFWPVMAFTASLILALLHGLATGGNTNIALWEIRPMLLLPLMVVLSSNLLEEPAHIINLTWLAMISLFVEGLIGTAYFFLVLGGSTSGVEAITEHSAAIHMNTLYIFAIAVYLFRGSTAHRIWIPLMMPVVLLTYFATQRRAAYLSLGIAILYIFYILYHRRRRLFWMIVPAALVAVTAYLVVFWNADGALAQPASAVKSMIAPDMSGKDYSSNLYRVLENMNIAHSIHLAPLTGVGFGNKFHILVPMPDISFFVWWEYVVHNSIMWVWVQTGLFGFLSMIFMIGYSIMTGIRIFWLLQDGTLRAVTLVATLYIVMHFMFAYVDMAWDTQSMLYLGAMMGVINCAEHVAAKHAAGEDGEKPAKRWPWQTTSRADHAPAAPQAGS